MLLRVFDKFINTLNIMHHNIETIRDQFFYELVLFSLNFIEGDDFINLHIKGVRRWLITSVDCSSWYSLRIIISKLVF